jgi:hypothetical protein
MLASNTGSSQAGTDKPDLIIYERQAAVNLSNSRPHGQKRLVRFLTNAHLNNTYENK